MPWTTLTLRETRELVRGEVKTFLSGASFIGNSVIRVLSDATGGMAHLVLRYIDWLSRMLLPDTATDEWLDRHGDIWLVNIDGTIGRKTATLAQGSATMTGTAGMVVPFGTQLSLGTVNYETLNTITIASGPTEVQIRALDAGTIGNADAGESLDVVVPIAGVDGTATVVSLTGGIDQESDALLRGRILDRIRHPPMGGSKTDYEQWAESVPGVTRAWCAPLEMGIGTVTVRFMMDDLRAPDGFPLPADVDYVESYLNTKRPVAVKDFFCEAPTPYGLSMSITNLVINSASTQQAIHDSIAQMLFEKAIPGGIIYRSWVDEAIAAATGVDHYDLMFNDTPMPNGGALAVVGAINFVV
jgi:uncharacterized phage protein gp47/JayE